MKSVDRSHYLFSNKALFTLMVPIIIEQLLALLVGMADSVMVSSVGEAAVSGVSLFDNIMILLINIFVALATGGAVVAGQLMGRKDMQQARHASEQLVWFIGIFSIAVMIIVYLLRHFLLYAVFGEISSDVRYHADQYLMVVTASIPFIAIFNAGAALFRIMGNSKISMKVSLLMNAINVIGNTIFIYGLHMGTEGVAISSLISRMVAAIVIIGLLFNKKLELHIKKSLRFRFDVDMIKSILSIGIPNSFENGMFQFGKIILLSLVATFGTASIAANAITGVIAGLQILPGIAASIATVTVISRCIGAGDYDQARYYNKKLLIITYIVMWIFELTFIALLTPILRLYNLTEETATITRQLVYCHTMGSLLIWPLSFNLPSTLRAAGDAKFTMMTSIISMWVFRLLMGYTLAVHFGLGVLGIWIAMFIDWSFRSTVFIIRYFSGKWENKSVVVKSNISVLTEEQ